MSTSKFGAEFDEVWPKESTKYTEFGINLLRTCENIIKPENVNIQEICKQSSEFPIKFPIQTCRIISQPKDRHSIIEDQINSAYPVIHERVLWLYTKFLEYKIQYGNSIEKEIYKDLTLVDFIERLLTKRCASFFGRDDVYLLLNGERGKGGFTNIGTEQETYPLLLRNCLSYDEIKLSALLSVSSYTEYLNDGNRNNCGKITKDRSSIENDGIIIGLIGARLSRKGLMEFQEIVINKTQNTIENGYGKTIDADDNEIITKWNYRQMWNEFYNEESILYNKDLKIDGKKFGNSKNQNDIFNNVMMKKRYTISFDTLLLESERRASLEPSKKQAYIHVVGIGLGVWRTAEQQEQIFLETFSQRIKVLGSKLKHVGFIHFSWFKLTECGDIKNNGFIKIKDHPDGGIKIFVSKRNPADKLKGAEFENCLLIVSYAWDGNALPGNEFWMGMLSSTGDSSSACSTLITEIHNPHINNAKVCGNNLHITSEEYGVIHVSDYVKKILNIEMK